MTSFDRRVSVLSIAGSDSGGGAGIQADLRTICAFGLHPLTAITALTAQNTRGVSAVQITSPTVVRAQIDAVFADFDVRAVKIGMLASAEMIDCVAAALDHWPAIPLVLDPVMVATSGARLLEPDAIDRLIQVLLPRATLITPNLPEAELLGAGSIPNAEAMPAAATALRRRGASAVLLKGGHLDATTIIDWLDSGDTQRAFAQPKLPVEGHGTGCSLASAIACGLATGTSLEAACESAIAFVSGALRHAYRPGLSSLQVLHHEWQRLPRKTM